MEQYLDIAKEFGEVYEEINIILLRKRLLNSIFEQINTRNSQLLLRVSLSKSHIYQSFCI